MELRCTDLARAVGGVLEGPDAIVDGASIDSRSVGRGQLFVPVVAERDGHAFIPDALAAGAVAYLTSQRPVEGGGSAIVVDDTVDALQAAGRLARSRLAGPVVGITGSVGKTSVKDLLASVTSQRLATAASHRSFNNELGVPLTLLNAPAGTEVAVVEMGARGMGHIALLCRIAAPTVGVVTRVAAVHTALFGTIDEVARAKSELVRALPSTGTAVLNAGDERVAAMAKVTDATVVTFGDGGDVRAVDVALDGSLRPRFELRSPWGDARVQLSSRGRHQVDNALAAATAGLVCGVSLEDVVSGLSAGTLSPWRMDLATSLGGALVLNDAYNANPTSVIAALESLSALPAQRRTAVLGVMAELGDGSDAEHARIADVARSMGVRVISVAAPAYRAEDVATVEEAATLLAGIGEGDAVLVKGSRVAGLERLAAALLSR
jgi:UDP-N-acetylmuramoyl-tripeptide--D-alanyl-D-alanine ligase